jgi:hypothetical protein
VKRAQFRIQSVKAEKVHPLFLLFCAAINLHLFILFNSWFTVERREIRQIWKGKGKKRGMGKAGKGRGKRRRAEKG